MSTKSPNLCESETASGAPCGSSKMAGLRVCYAHSGFQNSNVATRGHPRKPSPSGVAFVSKSQEASIVSAMRRFVTPIAADDVEANPLHAFEMEFRRTVARIRYFDDAIAELSEDNLASGETKREEINATEFAGTNITYEKQLNVFIRAQTEERKHLVTMTKIWIDAKLDTRKLEIESQKILLLDHAITNVLTKLGHNVLDAEVRGIVRTELLSLPTAGVPSRGATTGPGGVTAGSTYDVASMVSTLEGEDEDEDF